MPGKTIANAEETCAVKIWGIEAKILKTESEAFGKFQRENPRALISTGVKFEPDSGVSYTRSININVSAENISGGAEAMAQFLSNFKHLDSLNVRMEGTLQLPFAPLPGSLATLRSLYICLSDSEQFDQTLAKRIAEAAPGLEKLWIVSCNRELSEGTIAELNRIKGLKVFYLRMKNLEKMPAKLGMPGLEELYIENTLLEKLPSLPSNIIQLRLRDNRMLSEWGEAVGPLKGLKFLHLPKALITEHPEETSTILSNSKDPVTLAVEIGNSVWLFYPRAGVAKFIKGLDEARINPRTN